VRFGKEFVVCGSMRKNQPRSQIRDLLSDSLRSLESARTANQRFALRLGSLTLA